MSYFRIFAISVFASLLFLSIFVMVAFDSENNLKQAYTYFSQKRYYEARQHLLNEDHSIPLADFYLYEAYLAREELGIKKSQGYLEKAKKELLIKKSSTAFEIILNSALDAFLLKDKAALKIAIEEGLKYTSKTNPWIQFFLGNQAYLDNNFSLALEAWHASESRQWLSPWMRKSFENHFSSEQQKLNELHAQIETDTFYTAREKLKKIENTYSETYRSNIQYLLALSYLKEAVCLPAHEQVAAFQKANEYLSQIPSNDPFYRLHQSTIYHAFKAQAVRELQTKRYKDLVFLTNFLEKQQALHAVTELSEVISCLFTEKIITGNLLEATSLITQLGDILPEGKLKQLLSDRFLNHMMQAIEKGHIRHLPDYWNLSKSFLVATPSSVSPLRKVLQNKIFHILENDHPELALTKTYLSLWFSIESSSLQHYILAQELIEKAYHQWSHESNYQKALCLLKIAKSFSSDTHAALIHETLEKTMVKVYQSAALKDNIQEIPYIQEAIQIFKLSDLAALNQQETSYHFEDALYLFRIGDYKQALKKVAWVLHSYPHHLPARRIAALSAYQEGFYKEVLEHIAYLQELDHALQEAYILSKALINDEDPIFTNFDTLSEDTKLRLAYGYLTLSKTEKGLFWLRQLDPSYAEVGLGDCIAAFQMQQWDHAWNIYNQLPHPYKQIPALQGMLIQASIAQGKREDAESLFSMMNFETPVAHSIDCSQAFNILYRTLSTFDAEDFAGRYFLYVKNDPENALKHFQSIKNPNKNQLLERADLAISLQHYALAVSDLSQYLRLCLHAEREPALLSLGHLCFLQGYYHDSVRYYQEVFTLNEKQSSEVQECFSLALAQIGRTDLATKYTSWIHTPPPLKEDSFNFEPDLSKAERLHCIRSRLKDYPESLSLNILLSKVLIDESFSISFEDLFEAYAILTSLNRQYPLFPDVWYLQGQVLTKLHAPQAAKVAFTQSVLLNNAFIDAYKNLVELNTEEGDIIAASYNLKQILKFNPSDWEAWESLAVLYETHGLLHEALDTWRQLVQIHPYPLQYYKKMAETHLILHHTQEALQAIEQALAIQPSDGPSWNILHQTLQYLTLNPTYPLNPRVSYSASSIE